MKKISMVIMVLLVMVSVCHAGTAIKYPISWAFTAGSTYGRTQIQPVGAVALVVVDIPYFSNEVTGTLKIISNDGYVLYQKDNLAKGSVGDNKVHVISDFSVNFPADGTMTIEVRFSGAVGSAGTVKATLYTLR